MCDIPDDPIARLWYEGDWEALIPIMVEGIREARRAHDPVLEVESLSNLAFLLGETGQRESAIHAAWAVVRLRRKFGSPAEIAEAISMVGSALEQNGRPEDALRCHRVTLSIFRRLDLSDQISLNLIVLGRLQLDLGRTEEALRILEEARLGLPPESSDWSQSKLFGLLSEVYQVLRDLPSAIHWQHEAIQAHHRIGKYWPEGLNRLAGLCKATGKTWEAQQLMMLAHEQFQQSGRYQEAEAAAEQLRIWGGRHRGQKVIRTTWSDLKEPGLRREH